MKHLLHSWMAGALLLTAASAPALAAQTSPAPPSTPRPDGRPGMMRPPGGFGRGEGRREGETARILPPGTWWKDPELAKRIDLSPDQIKRIDDLFLQSRIDLVRMHASLEEAELLLEPMLNANPPDQARTLAQIGKIADQRAELEKANAKMLLSIRGVLNQQQWTKLQGERPGMRQHFMRMPNGPQGMNGGAGDRPDMSQRPGQ